MITFVYSDASIRRREIVRDRLVRRARDKEEKDKETLEEKKRQEEAERFVSYLLRYTYLPTI